MTKVTHPATGTCSAIDLTICEESIYMDSTWSTHNDVEVITFQLYKKTQPPN